MKSPALPATLVLAVSSMVLAAFAVGPAAPSNAAEEPSDEFPTPQIIEAQERLGDLADKIIEADVDERIATTQVSQKDLTLTVYLAAEVSPAIVKIVDAAPSDITTVIKRARFSMPEMQTASARIQAALERGTAKPYAVIVSNNDGSGLTVEVEDKVLQESGEAKLAVAYKDAADMPVSVELGEAVTPTSRSSTASPWRGGVQITNSNGGRCSTAFAVVRPDGGGRILTASHCDFTANLPWTTYSGGAFTSGGGNVSNDRVPYDTMIIDPTGGTQGRVFGGPWNAGSTHANYSLKVASAQGSHVGDFVCPSGANSGEHCTTTVQALGVSWACGINSAPPPAQQCGGHRARRTTAAPATVGGDSGGPVYENRSDGRVNALGVIFGGATSVPCGSTRFSTKKCYRDVYYPAIKPILSSWNVSIETVS